MSYEVLLGADDVDTLKDIVHQLVIKFLIAFIAEAIHASCVPAASDDRCDCLRANFLK